MSVTQTGMKKKALGAMNKDELKAVLDSIKVAYNEDDTNAVLLDRITESGRYATKKENSGGKVTIDEEGNRIHPLLGKYIKVKVHPTASHNAKTAIFCSINLYTVEFHPNEPVSLPIGAVKFLKGLGDPEHYYDPNHITENGNKGAHLTRMTPKYVVEIINDELEEMEA